MTLTMTVKFIKKNARSELDTDHGEDAKNTLKFGAIQLSNKIHCIH